MINYSDYTLKQFCCAFDLKTGTIIIAAAHFIILNSILYSWDQYTGEKIFWTIVQALSTVALFIGVIKNNYLLYVPWIVVVFPSAAAIIVFLAFLALALFAFIAPLMGFLYCFWCVFSAFDEVRKTDETRLSYDEPIA
ncbi:uncharacterized protein LOC119085450 [Bradysia coprophila]|uniref:uncharacterized protein LOC119085450 n=1 Tax=Bradysia coprophila TaxID=38358 RepID=UPI00187DC931|nr:uncharacterized protein LOC119085450 [Bradysia coprophila]